MVGSKWSFVGLALALAACGGSGTPAGSGGATGTTDTTETTHSTGSTAAVDSSDDTGEPMGPSWPDGPLELVPWSEIVFLRSDGERSAVMTMDRHGEQLGPIYEGGGPPKVSADGHHLLWRAEGAWELLEEGATEATPITDLAQVEWGPSGSTLAAERSDDVLVVRDLLAGTELELVATDFVRELAWSPQGRYLPIETTMV